MATKEDTKTKKGQQQHVNIKITGKLIAQDVINDGDVTTVTLSIKNKSQRYKPGKGTINWDGVNFVSTAVPETINDYITNLRAYGPKFPYGKPHETKEVKDHVIQVCATARGLNDELIAEASSAIRTADRVFVFGNGGSNATADHLVCDLVKACGKQSFSLSSLPTLTAYSNDDGYSNAIVNLMHAYQIDDGDAMVLISTSGNSKNVVKAAKEQSLEPTIIALTAGDGGKLAKCADININIPTDIIEVAEDVHSIVCHAIVRALK